MAASHVETAFLILLRVMTFTMSSSPKDLLPKNPMAFTGDDVVLTCLLTSNEGPGPASKVSFIHKHKVLTPSSRVEVHVVDNGTVQLTLRHVTTDDQGTYYCATGHPPWCHSGHQQCAHQHLQVFNWYNELNCVSPNFERLECHWNCPNDFRWEYNIRAAWLRAPARYTKAAWSGKHRCEWSFQHMIVNNSVTFLGIREFVLNFSVSAFHEDGYELKTQEHQVVPKTVVKPNKTRDLNVTAISSRHMTLTWRHPDGLGPDVLSLRYQVRYTEKSQHGRPKSKASAGSKTRYTLRDLRPGTTYLIEVRARPRKTGKWSESAKIEVITKEEAPLVPPAVFMTFSVPDCYGTCLTLDLFWKINNEIYTAGHILGCTVNVTEVETGISVMLKNVNCNDGHVVYGKRHEKRRYLLKLTASTKIGTSPPAQVNIPDEKERPPYPQLLSAEMTADDLVTIHWTRPNWDYPIENYTIFYCKHTFHKCKNLQALSVPGTHQQVTIRVDSRGFIWSISAESGVHSSGMKPNLLKCVYAKNKEPDPIPFTTRTTRDRQMILHFNVTCRPDAGFPRYINVTWCITDRCQDTQEEHTLSWDTRSFRISPTEHFTNYSVAVTSIGAGGESQSSVTIETQPTVPADPPRQVRINSSKDNQLIITWLQPETPNGRITKYEISLQHVGSDREIKYSSKGTAAIVSSLPSNTTFTVVVTAYVNDHLRSPSSIPVIGTTKIKAPDEVGTVDVHTISTREDISRINISWSPPRYPAAYIQGYQIQVQQVEKLYAMYTKIQWIDIVIPCNGTYSGFVVQVTVAAVNTLEETGRPTTVEHRICHFLGTTALWLVVGGSLGVLMLMFATVGGLCVCSKKLKGWWFTEPIIPPLIEIQECGSGTDYSPVAPYFQERDDKVGTSICNDLLTQKDTLEITAHGTESESSEHTRQPDEKGEQKKTPQDGDDVTKISPPPEQKPPEATMRDDAVYQASLCVGTGCNDPAELKEMYSVVKTCEEYLHSQLHIQPWSTEVKEKGEHHSHSGASQTIPCVTLLVDDLDLPYITDQEFIVHHRYPAE